VVLAASAHVIVSGWWIGTDHQEVSTSPKALMSGAGGQNDHITGLKAQCAPAPVDNQGPSWMVGDTTVFSLVLAAFSSLRLVVRKRTISSWPNSSAQAISVP
jgi:hypothetical protein